MLNKHNKGEVYFGVRNDGEPVGQTVSDKTLRDVSQAIANHIEPQIFPTVNNVVIDSKDCIHIEFEGDNVPYYAYGRAYLRVADEDRVMSPKELETYILKRNDNAEKWDSEPSDKTVDFVDEKLLKKYIDRANVAGRVSYTYTNKEDVLNKLNLLSGDKITNTACIMFSENPNLEIQMAVFATDEKTTLSILNERVGTFRSLLILQSGISRV